MKISMKESAGRLGHAPSNVPDVRRAWGDEERERGERSDEQQYADPVSSHDGLPKMHKKGERRDGRL